MRVRIPAFLFLLAIASTSLAQLPIGDFAITDEHITLAPGQRSGGAIVASRSGYLIVWVDERLSEPSVWGARVSKSGEILDPAGIRIASGRGYGAMASDGEDFLVAAGNGFRRVNADGTVVELPFQGAFPSAFVWTGDAYAAFFGKAGTVEVVLLDRDARTLVGTRTILQSEQGVEQFRVSSGSGGQGVLIAWTERNDPSLHHRLLDAGALRRGEVGALAPAPRASTSGTLELLDIASDGNGYLATVHTANGDRAYAFDANGVPASPVPVPALMPSLIWNGSRYAALASGQRSIQYLFRDGTPAGSEAQAAGAFMHIVATGTVDGRLLLLWSEERTAGKQLHVELDGVRTLLSRGYARRTDVAGSWRGDHYLAVWREDGDASPIVMNRIAPDGRRLDGAGVAIGTGSRPSLASDGRGAVIAWTSGDGVHVVFVQSDGKTTERIYTPLFQSTAPVVHWNGSQYLIVYAEAGVRAVRVTRGGTFVDVAPVQMMSSTGPIETVAWTGSQYVLTWWVEAGCGFCPISRTLWAQSLSPSLTPIGAKRAISCAGPFSKTVRVGESAEGVLFVFATPGFELWGSRISSSGVPLDPDSGFLIEYAKSEPASITTDRDGWVIAAGGEVWSLAGPDRPLRRRTGYSFVPPKSTMTLVEGGPAPLVIYRRPATGSESSEPIRARYVVTRQQAIRR